jgi:hypothetical protein
VLGAADAMAKYRRKARRDRITLQEPVTDRTTMGHPKVTGYTDILTNLHADFHQVGGTETFRGQQLEATVIGIFELRNPRQVIDPKWRVLHTNKDDVPYEIVATRLMEEDHEGGDRTMWIMVKGVQG